MLKRLMLLAVAAVTLGLTGCCALTCESPCYGKHFQREAGEIADCLNLNLLNYDKHDPYRCDPCSGRYR
jgi:hypothetical protein